MTQEEAFNIMKTGANVFLTGEPGSGKTHTVNRFVRYLREHGLEPAVTASTGIAATHIGGMTIHSWSGIGIRSFLNQQDLNHIAGTKRLASRIKNTHTLIIDEISMLSARTFGMVEAACRAVRGGSEPFGGIQVILVGDFFQLPPVVRRQEPDPFSDTMLIPTEDDRASFAFDSSAWESLDFTVCYLSEQHRQEDAAFLGLLSALRGSVIGPAHRALLEARRSPEGAANTTHLFSHNVDVDRMNLIELEKLPGTKSQFLMDGRGANDVVAGLKRGCLSPEELYLKVGARVMFTKNDPAYRFVNGTLGIVTGFSEEDGWPIVKTNGGRTIVAEPEDWSVEEGGRVVARVSQVPLRLAWAMTVHKSQGMSLDGAHMDLRGAFEHGQGYVALSRVRTLAGLSIVGWNERALQVHSQIRVKDVDFRAASQAAEAAFRRIPESERLEQEKEFIKACGGSVDIKVVKERDGLPDFSKPKTKRWAVTFDMIGEKKSLAEMAAEQDIKPRTVLSHIQELLVLDKITAENIAYLVADNQSEIEEAQEAFREVGSEKLKPAFDYCEGRIDYDTLELARLLMEK